MTVDSILKAIPSGFSQFTFVDAIDIIIMAFLLYRIIVWTKRTRAYQVVKGIAILIIAYAVSALLSLTTLSWLFGIILQSGIVVIVILFQPELRRVLERLGRGRLFGSGVFARTTPESAEIVRGIYQAVLNMAKRRVGALIVVEQRTGLGEIIATGTRIEAVISGALIENIFEPNTPLHDGAIVIRDGEIAAAGCLLPLSEDIDIARELGTRHRAALGVSAISDSITLVVSEETGIISMAHDGKLVRYIDAKALKDILENLFLVEKEGTFAWLRRDGKDGR